MRRNAGEYHIGIGSSSVLMILVVIALAALSLLSLSRARENEALSNRTLSMTLSYYQAASQTQRILAAVDDMVKDHADGTLRAEDWNSLFSQRGLDMIVVDENENFAFSLDAGAGRLLIVEGTFTLDSSPHYMLTRHELTSGNDIEEPVLQLLIP